MYTCVIKNGTSFAIAMRKIDRPVSREKRVKIVNEADGHTKRCC